MTAYSRIDQLIVEAEATGDLYQEEFGLWHLGSLTGRNKRALMALVADERRTADELDKALDVDRRIMERAYQDFKAVRNLIGTTTSILSDQHPRALEIKRIRDAVRAAEAYHAMTGE